MARKGWDSLSDNYRARLGRSGVTQSAYESGAPLTKARGHTSAAKESYDRSVNKFVKDYADSYRRDRGDLKKRFKALGPTKGRQVMRSQRESQRLYESGEIEKAKQRWEHRDRSLPDYLFYYHGVFNW